MDLREALRQLYTEKKRIETVIASLEEIERNKRVEQEPVPATHGKRGRKSMSAKERRGVSERMKKYWAKRRPQ